MRRCLSLILIVMMILLLLLALPMVAIAQEEKQYHYGFINVDLAVQINGDIKVTEVIQFVFTRGSFREGFRTISLNRVESIGDIRLSEEGVPYRLVSSEMTNGYMVTRSGNAVQVTWWFPPTRNASRTFTLSYVVKGGLRIYEGGDQLYWKAIWPDRGQKVLTTQTTVYLPAEVDPAQLKIASYGAQATYTQPNASTIVFTTGVMPNGQELEIRVQFPHGIVQTSAPAWQQADDERIRREEELAPWRALVALISFFGMIVIPVAGGVGLYIYWYNRGRDKPVGLIADYLPNPPSDLPPGVVGTLIDETADLKDIIASIVDLARRGVIAISERETPGFFGFTNRDFVFTLVKPDTPLRAYEQRLLTAIFDGRREVELSDLRNKFYTAIPELKEKLYQEVVKEGFFTESPSTTRSRWIGLGILILILAGIAFVMLLSLFGEFTGAVVLPAIGLGILGVMTMIAGNAMPRRTDKGAEAAARWKAFARYLQNIEKYTNLKEAKDIFDKYLPYAITFGLERSWIRKFAQVETPAPAWWGPYTWGPRPYYEPQSTGGGTMAGEGSPWPAMEGTGSGSGLPGLQEASDSMLGGLQSISDGLISMLNSAGSILSSQPSSSGGGGGWSGGGSGGGGGGGGGSSGAR